MEYSSPKPPTLDCVTCMEPIVGSKLVICSHCSFKSCPSCALEWKEKSGSPTLTCTICKNQEAIVVKVTILDKKKHEINQELRELENEKEHYYRWRTIADREKESYREKLKIKKREHRKLKVENERISEFLSTIVSQYARKYELGLEYKRKLQERDQDLQTLGEKLNGLTQTLQKYIAK